MRLKISKSKNSTSLYVIKTIYIDEKEYTKTVEKLGTVADLEKRLDSKNPIEWTQKTIDTNPTKLKKNNQNDYKRFIQKTHCTSDGEIESDQGRRLSNSSRLSKSILGSFSNRYVK